MGQIAIVAMGLSAHEYMRTVETSGNRKNLFDEVWMVNGFGHIFQHERLFAMDDIRLQAMRGKAGNHKIGRLVEFLRHHPGPVYTSRVLAKEPPSQERIDQLRMIVRMLPEGGEERQVREDELATLEIERELILGGGFHGLVPFPLEEVVNHFRVHPYFNSTVAYAIALAALEGHDMTIYGADFIYPEAQANPLVEKGRGCCEFWIGMATGIGLEVRVTNTSTLMDAHASNKLYGYDGVNIDGTLCQDGSIKFKMEDCPLPNAQHIEARYYKGAPSVMGVPA